MIFVLLSMVLFAASEVVTPPVDTETESLHQKEEELFSPSDINQFHGALSVGSLMGW